MQLSVISFTQKGRIRSLELLALFTDEGKHVSLFTKCSLYKEEPPDSLVSYVEESIQDFARTQMEQKNALLFIGACGIAVRAIAPWVKDKLQDSPVLVMDDCGRYVIPILSGHVGGANELAIQIAQRTGAVPVITTATDIHQTFAVDVFAKRNQLQIVNKAGIARVSSKALAGEMLTMSVQNGHMAAFDCIPKELRMVPYPPRCLVDILVSEEQIQAQALIGLRPKTYVIGMGCKKGKAFEKIELMIEKSIQKAGIDRSEIYALASIDKKKDEEGFLMWAKKNRCPFLTYSADELQKVEGSFHTSAFVEQQVGVDNVCERAALLGCGKSGTLIYEKHSEDGMTIAIAKREWSVSFYEE